MRVYIVIIIHFTIIEHTKTVAFWWFVMNTLIITTTSDLHPLEVTPDASMERPHRIAVHEGADTVISSVRPLVSVYVPGAATRSMIFGAPVELLTKQGCRPSIPIWRTWFAKRGLKESVPRPVEKQTMRNCITACRAAQRRLLKYKGNALHYDDSSVPNPVTDCHQTWQFM